MTVDDQIANLETLLGRDQPTVTVEITYRRGRLIFADGDVQVHGVHASHGSARGLIWVTDASGGTPTHEVMESSSFRQRHPMVERRHEERRSS